MADDAVAEDFDEDFDEIGGKKKFSGKKLILFVVLPIILLGGGGLAFMMMSGGDKKADEAKHAEPAKTAPDVIPKNGVLRLARDAGQSQYQFAPTDIPENPRQS